MLLLLMLIQLNKQLWSRLPIEVGYLHSVSNHCNSLLFWMQKTNDAKNGNFLFLTVKAIKNQKIHCHAWHFRYLPIPFDNVVECYFVRTYHIVFDIYYGAMSWLQCKMRPHRRGVYPRRTFSTSTQYTTNFMFAIVIFPLDDAWNVKKILISPSNFVPLHHSLVQYKIVVDLRLFRDQVNLISRPE